MLNKLYNDVMIIRRQERAVKEVKSLRQGTGVAIIDTIASSEQTFDHAKMYANVTLRKGCGIGYHNHVDETEIIMVNSGKATYNDDGKEFEAYPQDVLICEDGHFHSIRNENDEELIITALVIKK